MSDDNGSHKGLGAFLNQIRALILAAISFILGVYGFVKLFADKDAGLVTLISLTVGILLLLGVCLYYARFWQPERQDRTPLTFSRMSDEQVQAQAKKARYRKRIRRSALAGLILIPILSLSGIAGWFYAQSLPAKNIIVLVADFDGPDAKAYRVTETVIGQLRQAAKRYADIEVQALNGAITEQEGSAVARAEGKKRKAAIVIWGWYGTPGDVVPLSVHFEVLNPPRGLPDLGQATGGSNVQQAPIADLKSFALQTRLSNEMTYLSLFVLGMARRAAGDWEGAVARFSDALGQMPEASSGLNKSLVYYYRGGTYLMKGDAERALADLNQAIALQPTLAEAYANRSLIFAAKGDYISALADANQALAQMPDSAVTYNSRGYIYMRMGDFDRAIADFDQALKQLVEAKDASDAANAIRGRQLGAVNLGEGGLYVANFVHTELSVYSVLNNRGITYLSKGDSEHALTDFNQAIKLRPDRALAYLNRATVYFARQDYDRALHDLNQVIRLQSDLALAYVKRGSVYYFKGEAERALADLDRAITLQPDSAISYNVRASLYVDRGDHARAIADFSQLIKLQPDFVTAYLDRGRSYRELGDYERAFADFNQALQLSPSNAEAYNARGWTYAQKGAFERALADLNRALTLKPDEANFYDSRGFIYAGKGEYNRALEDYNKALELKPDADYAHYHRGVVYRALGNHQKATADFKRTLELTKDSKRRQDAEQQLQELKAR